MLWILQAGYADDVSPSNRFTGLLTPDPELGGYAVVCPELGVASQGETVEEALVNIQEAVECFLESFDEGEEPEVQPAPMVTSFTAEPNKTGIAAK